MIEDAKDYQNRPWIFTPAQPLLARGVLMPIITLSLEKVWSKFILKFPADFFSLVIWKTNDLYVYSRRLFGLDSNYYTKGGFPDKISKITTLLMFPLYLGGVGVAYLLHALFTRSWPGLPSPRGS